MNHLPIPYNRTLSYLLLAADLYVILPLTLLTLHHLLLAADEVARRRDDGIEEELAALAQARQEAKERKEVRDKERSEKPPQPQPQAASSSSSSSKVQLALLTTALACQEKDETIAKLEAEYERYLMKKTESEELANALRRVPLT